MKRALAFVLSSLAVGCGSSHTLAAGIGGGGGAANSLAGSAGAAGDTTPLAGGGAGGAGPRMSAGCGVTPTRALSSYVQYQETVPDVPEAYVATHSERIYYVRLPATYDPNRAYPTVFLGPGCGAAGDSPIPVQVASKEDAILIGLNGIDNCFNKEADSPELAYFDETLKRVEAGFCVDPNRVFVAGFSSGSWLANLVGCARAGVIRGQGSSAGGLPPVPTCTGPIAAMFAADTADPSQPPAVVQLAVDRVREINGCSTETEPYDFGAPSTCVQYKGCLPGFPLVSCVTTGLGHTDQSKTKISTVGFWHFWSSLP